MPTCVVRIVEPLLGFLWPAAGRHRSSGLQRMPEPSLQRPRVPALRGEDIGIVRPYLVAHERRQREHQRSQAAHRQRAQQAPPVAGEVSMPV